ncbi:MAG: hypothetical protein DHS20C01_14080 [marine bacterium B5-7]|nr:MAG: hypothetical protein DHS20C01_14080 [marine bacterium B5-7]
MYFINVVILFAYLTLPGLAITRLFRLNRHVFLLSVALSIVVLVITQVPVRMFKVSIDSWILSIAVVTLVVLVMVKVTQLKRQGIGSIVTRQHPSGVYVGAALIAGIWTIYYLLVGGYSEVPSDFWNHLLRITWEFRFRSPEHLISMGSNPGAYINRDFTHTLHAVVASRLNIAPLDLVATTGYVITTLFLVSVYWFAYALFEPAGSCGMSRPKRIAIAILSVLLMVLWKGTGPFSFIRYYAMGPAIFGFILYFTFLLLWSDILKLRQYHVRHLLVAGMLAVVMLMIHQQEVGFAILMAAAMLVLYYLFDQRSMKSVKKYILLSSIILGVLVAIAGSIALIMLREPKNIGSYKLLYLGDYVPYFEDVFILNPSWQFLDTVGWFGIASLLLFTLNYRLFSGSIIVWAGVLVPLLTVFNPAFVYIYLHVAKYETLWRLLFILPVSFISARIGIEYVMRFKTGGTFRRVTTILVSIFMLALLLPFSLGDYRNTSSRLGSLVDTRAQGENWIRDVVERLNTVPRNHVYTDPVTAYVLRGATHHIVKGWKFYAHTSGYDFNKLLADGELPSFLRKRSGIYVINRRRTEGTGNGQDSGHWPADVLFTEKWYPDDLSTRLIQHGSKLIYRNDNIEIYVM